MGGFCEIDSSCAEDQANSVTADIRRCTDCRLFALHNNPLPPLQAETSYRQPKFQPIPAPTSSDSYGSPASSPVVAAAPAGGDSYGSPIAPASTSYTPLSSSSPTLAAAPASDSYGGALAPVVAAAPASDSYGGAVAPVVTLPPAPAPAVDSYGGAQSLPIPPIIQDNSVLADYDDYDPNDVPADQVGCVKDGCDDLVMTLPPFRLHPSHLTHMAPAWTRSPELSPSLQTTHSRCSMALSPFQGSSVYLKDISDAFHHGQDSYGQPVETFGAPVLTDAPVVVTSSDNLPASEAFGVPVPVGTSAPGIIQMLF